MEPTVIDINNFDPKPPTADSKSGVDSVVSQRVAREAEQDFIGYLIDNCEREVITEEFLQNTYGAYLKAVGAAG